MIGLKVRLAPLPEQPGEPRISVHWFFLPTALFYVAGGVACLRYNIVYGGWACVFIGVFTVLTFVLCQRRIRAGKPPQALFTLPLRKTILICTMFGYLMLFAVILSRIHGQMVLLVMPLWLVTAPLLWNAMVRYFVNHPPKQ